MRVHRRLLAAAPGLAIALLAACLALADEKPERKELEQLLAGTDEIAAKVSAVRGLPLETQVARRIMSREEIRARILQRLAEEYSDAKVAGQERALKRFGVFPPDGDLKATIVALLTDQIGGFYDPRAKELYLADWIDAPIQRLVMTHELCHALQDQSFNLDTFMKSVRDDDDVSLARQAVVEGDGVALMIEFAMREADPKANPWADDTVVKAVARESAGASSNSEVFAKAPLFLRESLLFPYVRGLSFIANARRNQPWTSIDEMFRTPPASSEQVIHPEKYFARESPLTVKTAALPALEHWKSVEENVLGEAAFGWLWRQHGVGDERAESAAAGWAGDHYVLFAPAGDDGKSIDHLVLISYSVWDSQADAVEAFDVAVEAAPAWLGVATPAERRASFVRFENASGAQSWIERRGTKLVITIGQPAELARLRKEIWARWR
jgi:hypothetical protein